jgi:hypothetical protein
MKLTPEEIARAKEIGLDLPEHHTKPSIDVTTGASFDGAVITSGMAAVAREFTELQRLRGRTMLSIEYPDGDDGITIGHHPGDVFVHD